MASFLPSSMTISEQYTTHNSNTHTTPAGLPTPPPLTEPPPPPLDENIPHDQLVSKYKELQASNASLWSQIVSLQAQNDNWVQVYEYVEKGLAVKVKEMNDLVRENQQLKARNTHLSQQLNIKLIPENQRADELVAPIVLKQIQHLQDQVRARDLVIDLMKKAEQERTEKELEDKLDRQRRELELRLGLSAGPPTLSPTPPENPIRSVRQSGRGGKSSSRGGKTAAKAGSTTQTRKTSGTKRKRSTTLSNPPGSSSNENIIQAEDEGISRENCSPVGVGREGEKVALAGHTAPSRDGVEGDLLLEEVDQALEELFNE